MIRLNEVNEQVQKQPREICYLVCSKAGDDNYEWDVPQIAFKHKEDALDYIETEKNDYMKKFEEYKAKNTILARSSEPCFKLHIVTIGFKG
jgi:uncharacterized protein (DUF924 family)